MRIVAGRLGGRQFSSPKSNRTHPMSERVRGGLFNALGDIEGLSILDAFAGSGALSFEAISRGAKSAIAIDLDKKASQILQRNIKELGLEKMVKAIHANVSGWSDNNPDLTFDLVFAAPPYDGIKMGLLEKLTKHVSSGGLYILDWPGSEEIPEFDELLIAANKSYGDAQVIFYKRKDDNE